MAKRRTGTGPKNRVAVTLARLRARKLSPKRRREIARSAARARWQPADPLADAKPVDDLSVLIGGLPDSRDAEEILRDLRAARRPRRVSE
jgi:hypothetical protein